MDAIGRTTTSFVHDVVTFENTFTYSVGRNETITWHEIPEFGCDVWINGDHCASCSLHRCADGFPARHVDCTNVVDTGGGIYDSCYPYSPGGLFEYFAWFDGDSPWTGCLPFYYESIHVDREWTQS